MNQRMTTSREQFDALRIGVVIQGRSLLTRATDAEFPVRWCSPAREGAETQRVAQHRTSVQEGVEIAGKRTETQAGEAYAPTTPDNPVPRATRPTRPTVPVPAPACLSLRLPACACLPAPAPACACLPAPALAAYACLPLLHLLRFGAVPAKPAGNNGDYSRTVDVRTLI